MMDYIKELSAANKALTLFVVVSGALTVLGLALGKGMGRKLGSVGIGLLIGTAIMDTLDDPEAEEPIPLWFRAIVGYGCGIIFGAVTYLLPRVWAVSLF